MAMIPNRFLQLLYPFSKLQRRPFCLHLTCFVAIGASVVTELNQYRDLFEFFANGLPIIECKLYGDTDGVTKDIFSGFMFLEHS